MSSFFKVSRDIFNSDIWKDAEPYDRRSAWIYLIGMANFKTSTKVYKGQVQTTERGQVQTSVEKLAAEWRWSRGRVRRYIRLLERLGMVQSNGTPNGTTLTLENYAKYQDTRPAIRPSNESPDGSADGPHYKKDKECIKKGEETRVRATPQESDSGLDDFLAGPYAEDNMTDEEAEQMIAQWDREIAERRARGERLVEDDDE